MKGSLSLTDKIKTKIDEDGFAVVDNIFTDKEVQHLIEVINQADSNRAAFRKTNDLFAIRQFFKEIPLAVPVVFNEAFSGLIENVFGTSFFAVKSIYFDKPAGSNWFVSYHQDLTISVDKRTELENFGPWTVKQNQFAVQPPLGILEDNFTARIHLDDATEENGALKVIPASHKKGICRVEHIDWAKEQEHTCCANKGAVMFMKPLLLHASGRTTNAKKRRVLHIEFSRIELPSKINWSERLIFQKAIACSEN
jgi:hypothetical protein